MSRLGKKSTVNRILTNEIALIVGGCIGGPVAAMALQRTGIEAVVHEAYDAPSDYAGLFLNTAPKAAVRRLVQVDLTGLRPKP